MVKLLQTADPGDERNFNHGLVDLQMQGFREEFWFGGYEEHDGQGVRRNDFQKTASLANFSWRTGRASGT